MDKIPNFEIGQIALVVKDTEKTSQNIAKLFGLEESPFEMMGEYELANTHYKGKPTPAKARAAFYSMGSVSLEILEPIGGPSTWNDFLQEKGEGIHHIAWYVKEIEKVAEMMESRGMPMVQKGNWDGGQYMYFDSVKELGFMIELLQTDD